MLWELLAEAGTLAKGLGKAEQGCGVATPTSRISRALLDDLGCWVSILKVGDSLLPSFC